MSDSSIFKSQTGTGQIVTSWYDEVALSYLVQDLGFRYEWYRPVGPRKARRMALEIERALRSGRILVTMPDVHDQHFGYSLLGGKSFRLAMERLRRHRFSNDIPLDMHCVEEGRKRMFEDMIQFFRKSGGYTVDRQ